MTAVSAAEASEEKKPSGLRLLLKGAVLMLTLAAIGWAVKASGLHGILDEHWIDEEVRGQGLYGEALFVGMGLLALALGFPRQMVAFLGGYAFGFWIGSGLAVLATVLACVVNFFYARLFGRELVMARFAHRIAKVDHFLKGHPFSMTLLIRFLPVGNNLLTNLVAGVSSVPAFAFIAGSALGYLPQTVVFALWGSGIKVDSLAQIAISAVLFLVSGGLGVYLFQKVRRDRRMAEDLDGIGGTPGDPDPAE